MRHIAGITIYSDSRPERERETMDRASELVESDGQCVPEKNQLSDIYYICVGFIQKSLLCHRAVLKVFHP